MLIVIFCLLILFTYQDIRYYAISSWFGMPIIWMYGLNYDLNKLFLALPIYFSLLYLNRCEKYIGNGDIDIFFIQFLYLTFEQWLACIQLSCFFGILLSLFLKSKKIPLIPCITASFGLIIFFNWL